jgi:2'-5' RNA ligase
MRLFVAIVPPSAVLAELAAAVEPLQAAVAELRWTGSGAWHLTLAFLGEVDDAVLPELSTRLERAARRHPPQRLEIAGGGAFPRPTRARILWAGINADGRALASLAASVAAGARRAGAPPPDEGRKYSPHLTLARCRQPTNVAALTAALTDFNSTAWIADSVHLVWSHPGSGAPRYETVGEWPLLAAGQARS